MIGKQLLKLVCGMIEEILQFLQPLFSYVHILAIAHCEDRCASASKIIDLLQKHINVLAEGHELFFEMQRHWVTIQPKVLEPL